MKRVLLIQLEFPTWGGGGRHYSYLGDFAFIEGMNANGVETFMLPAMYGIPSSSPSSWLSRAKRLCQGMTFDQVWVWLIHNYYDDDFFDWISEIAPVRVGWLLENLSYTKEDYEIYPALIGRREYTLSQMKTLTHILVGADETEVDVVTGHTGLKAIWSPISIPRRFISAKADPPRYQSALFLGSPYGSRQVFLDHPDLSPILKRPESPEDALGIPQRYDAINKEMLEGLESGKKEDLESLRRYLAALEAIRGEAFDVYLDCIRDYTAMVNLPSFGKAYTGKVYEAMAAGRPVIAWAPPGRPRTRALFEEGKEILIFGKDEPERVVEHIRRLQKDSKFAMAMVRHAQEKLLRYHTSEMRMQSIFQWIETGEEPVYSDEEAERRRPKSFGSKAFHFLKRTFGGGKRSPFQKTMF